jgi:tRNA pseudouridine38-40 synthase
MVRIMVGTLVSVGKGQRPASAMSDLISSGDRECAGITAPAHGLFLVSVVY